MSRRVRGKVAVIGGAGFIGSHVVEELRGRGCDVLVLDNLCVGRREWVQGARFVHCDITTSEERLTELLDGCRFVFNYAAHPYIPESFDRPLHCFETTATGAMKAINAAHAAGVEGFMQISSAELYGEGRLVDTENPYDKGEEGAIKETDPVVPHSSYGVAKAAVDAYVQVRWREAQVPCIALRQFNCVGERETHPYIVPEIMSQLGGRHRGMPRGTIRLGNNSARDFLYAGDAARMAVELMEGGAFGEVYNLGSERSIKIYELAQLIGKIAKIPVEVQPEKARMRPWEIWSLKSDNRKAYAAGVSAPRVSLEDALRRTYLWYKEAGKWPWQQA